jgi:two-component system sensor histidine kinase KdpD
MIDELVQRLDRSGPVHALIPDDLPVADAMPAYIERILENLVRNADKYSPKFEPIDVLAARLGEEIVVTVSDRGPGVMAHELDEMFKQFYRSGRTASVAPGMGIGLTVCKRLSESQGGRIWAENRQEGGLAVSFTMRILDQEDLGE